MKYGFVLPMGGPREAADLAREAEQAGWDGFFLWESLWGFDAWVMLAAAAVCTQKIRLGTMISPLSRMRPWTLASETLALDHLSGGRVILSLGLGALDTGFAAFGEVTDRLERAQRLDEGLDLLRLLWQGKPFSYHGQHYNVEINDQTFHLPLPPPSIQQPGIPIWMVGAWLREKSMQRVLRCNGLLPNMLGVDGKVQMTPPGPEDIRQMCDYIANHRSPGEPFDIIVEGQTPGDDPAATAAKIVPLRNAGATWWIEAAWTASGLDVVLARIRQGPPR